MSLNPTFMRMALDELRKKDRGYLHPRPYTDFLPAKLGNRQPANEEAFNENLLPINQSGENASKLQTTLLKNKAAKKALSQAKSGRGDIRSLLHQLEKNQPEHHKNKPGTIDLSGINIKLLGGKHGNPVRVAGGGWGKDRIPEVSDIRGRLHPMMRHHLTTFSMPGLPNSITVNRTVAPIFRAFLKDLMNSGYKINSIGSHNIREQASGSGLMSLHSYGLAIDINAGANPYQDASGHMVSNMPPGVGKLAARYGLSWGGNWHNSKDPMHFSVAWGGRE